MSATSLDSQLQRLWPLLEQDEKKSILTFVRSFVERKEGQQRLTIEQYNEELEAAGKRIDAGQFTSIEDALLQSEKW